MQVCLDLSMHVGIAESAYILYMCVGIDVYALCRCICRHSHVGAYVQVYWYIVSMCTGMQSIGI